MSDRHYRNHDRDRHRDGRDDYYGSEVKSHHHHSSSSKSGSSSSSHKDGKRRSKDKYDSKRKKHKRSRTRSRSRSRDRRSSERDRRHREKSTSRSPHRKHGDDRSSRDYKNKSKDTGRRSQRSHSRSASRERERAREKNKQEVKLQMQRNYEEQLEKMRNANSLASTQTVPLIPPVNPASRLVEQIQQRKLLFSKKPEETTKPVASTSVLWKQPTFSDDSDGKMSAKFKRLMGMKDDSAASQGSSGSKEPDVVKKQEQYFAELEKQYEVARMTTHTQRGLGLGFGSSTSLR